MGKIKRVKDIRKLKRVMEVTGCYAFRIGLFFSMIFMVLADSIVKAVYSWTTGVQVPAVVITILSILPIVVSVVCLTQINVQGKRSVGMLMLLITLIVAVLLMLFLPVKMASSQIGFALAFTIAAFLLMLLSFGYVFLQQFYSVNLPFIMGLPLIVSMVMGLVLTIIVKLLSPHIGEPVSLVISMILGSLMYFGTLTAARNVTSHDIQFLYGDKIQKLFCLFIK